MNVRRAVMPVVCLLVAVGSAFAQHRVDPGRMYERIYAIVPMIGSGTWDDPKRPMFAPLPQQMAPPTPPPTAPSTSQDATPVTRTGIIAFNQVQSDDGNFALIEIVVPDRVQLAQIVGQMNAQLSSATGFQLFDRSVTPGATIQSAFQALKKNFDVTKFRVVVP